eukprot:scaffold71848_cov63-Phaeocystis_antarctica.AAC.5
MAAATAVACTTTSARCCAPGGRHFPSYQRRLLAPRHVASTPPPLYGKPQTEVADYLPLKLLVERCNVSTRLQRRWHRYPRARFHPAWTPCTLASTSSARRSQSYSGSPALASLYSPTAQVPASQRRW